MSMMSPISTVPPAPSHFRKDSQSSMIVQIIDEQHSSHQRDRNQQQQQQAQEGRKLFPASSSPQHSRFRIIRSSTHQTSIASSGMANKNAPHAMPLKLPQDYTVQDVSYWLTQIGMSALISLFQQHGINGRMLCSMTGYDFVHDLSCMPYQANKIQRELEYTIWNVMRWNQHQKRQQQQQQHHKQQQRQSESTLLTASFSSTSSSSDDDDDDFDDYNGSSSDEDADGVVCSGACHPAQYRDFDDANSVDSLQFTDTELDCLIERMQQEQQAQQERRRRSSSSASPASVIEAKTENALTDENVTHPKRPRRRQLKSLRRLLFCNFRFTRPQHRQ